MIDDSFDDAALRRMHERGVRGVRFNMVSGNGTPEDQLDALARRLAPLGWHIQIYAEDDKLAEIAPRLARLPVDVVIDHSGGVKAALGTAHPQFQALLRLLESGRAWVKVYGYRASSRRGGYGQCDGRLSPWSRTVGSVGRGIWLSWFSPVFFHPAPRSQPA